MEKLQSAFQLSSDTLEPNEFKGRASVFGNIVDSFIPTVIHPGAFLKTIAEQSNRIKILWQHDSWEPIGIPLSLHEGDGALIIHGRISQTQRGTDAVQLMKDGVVDALSIGFDATKFDFEETEDGELTRHVREVRLWEISLVTWGADDKAKITDAASKLFKTDSIPYQDLPLVDDINHLWDAPALQAWGTSGGSPTVKYSRAFAWKDTEQNSVDSHRLPIAGVVGGKLYAMPSAIFLSSAQLAGIIPMPEMPSAEVEQCKAHLSTYYQKMRETYGDDTLIPPWEEDAPTFFSRIHLFERRYWPCIIADELRQIDHDDQDSIAVVSQALSRLLPIAAEPPRDEALTAQYDQQLADAELLYAQTLMDATG